MCKIIFIKIEAKKIYMLRWFRSPRSSCSWEVLSLIPLIGGSAPGLGWFWIESPLSNGYRASLVTKNHAKKFMNSKSVLEHFASFGMIKDHKNRKIIFSLISFNILSIFYQYIATFEGGEGICMSLIGIGLLILNRIFLMTINGVNAGASDRRRQDFLSI